MMIGTAYPGKKKTKELFPDHLALESACRWYIDKLKIGLKRFIDTIFKELRSYTDHEKAQTYALAIIYYKLKEIFQRLNVDAYNTLIEDIDSYQ